MAPIWMTAVAGRMSARPTVASREPPSPPGHFLTGHAGEMLRDAAQFLLRAHASYGDVVRLRLGPRVAFAIFHPDHVYHVLVKHRENYTKQARGYNKLRQVVGNGLLTSEGDFWLRQRRLLQPAFAPAKLAGFADAMVTATEEMSRSWEPAAERGEAIDVADEMMRLTMRIVGETLLGTDVTGEASDVGPALSLVLDEVSRRIHTPWNFLERLPLAGNRRYERALQTLNRSVQKIIDEHRAEPARAVRSEDLLTMLMAARDEETDSKMSDQQLRDEVMTFFLAGHETTAKALTWTFYLLSKHVEVRSRLEREIDTVLSGRPATAEDLPKLSYAKQVVQESMRLFPPVWGLARMTMQEDQIGDVTVPGGSPVLISQYVTHRHRGFWENPEGFDPDRFLPGRSEGRHPYAYFPFGAGPRICIGNHFAMLESVLILATIASRWSLNLIPGRPVIPESRVTLRPKHGLFMSAEPR
ncbi:MAG TPA: cytochrome P450 [Planctomycetaceae bacterium]|nr:cytochrome P450 [Planctomycetaceae bacterium]